MQVVILCGGLGTRLREETEYRPKPMVPIGGRPILWHIMKTYAHHGHKEFILCLGYKGEIIKDYFRNYLWHTSDVTLKLGREPEVQYHTHHDEEDWTVTLLDTGAETQTGGRLARALPHVREENFLFTYGDGLSDCDINAAVEFHESHGAVATATAVKRLVALANSPSPKVLSPRSPRKPDQEPRFVNGGYCVSTGASASISLATTASLSASRLSSLPAKASSRPIVIPATGSAWIPTASSNSSRPCGRPAMRRGKFGRNVRRILQRQNRVGHRPHRVQGRVAQSMAAASGRPRAWLRTGVPRARLISTRRWHPDTFASETIGGLSDFG